MIKTFNKPTRCKCKNKNNKTCLNKQLNLYNLDNIYMCWLHYNYYCEKYATLIQAYYKAYKQRKLIKNVYEKLPDDIQYKILHSVREEYYYKKRLKIIEAIMINKLKSYSCDHFGVYDEDNFAHFKYFEYIVKNRIYIIHLFKLYSKYSQILSYNFIKNFHHLTDNLILMNYKIVDYRYKIFDAYTNDIYEVTCATYFILEKILFDGGFITQS